MPRPPIPGHERSSPSRRKGRRENSRPQLRPKIESDCGSEKSQAGGERRAEKFTPRIPAKDCSPKFVDRILG